MVSSQNYDYFNSKTGENTWYKDKCNIQPNKWSQSDWCCGVYVWRQNGFSLTLGIIMRPFS